MRYNFFTVGLCLFGAAPALAAPITWGTPFELVSDANIDLRYPVVYALNAGDTTSNPAIYVGTAPTSPLPLTIGSKTILFDGVEAVYGAGSTFGSTTTGDLIDHVPGSSSNVTFSTTGSRTTSIPQVSLDKFSTTAYTTTADRVYSVSTGNTALDTILNSQVYVDGRTIGTSALNISLNNLTLGVQYQVQVIGAADNRVGANSPSVSTLNDGLGNSVTGLSGFADLDGVGGAHVTSVLGTFTAGGTSQIVNAVLEARRNNGISAVIVTAVPEPTSFALVAIGSTLLLRRRAHIKR